MPFDPHDDTSIIRPDVSPADAIAVARSSFGIEGTVKELGSNQDRNYLLTPAQGDRYLLKFDNDTFSLAELEIQNEALRRLAASGLAVPAPVAALDGAYITTASIGDRRVRARLLTFVEGISLVDDGHLFPAVVARMGQLAGRVITQLAELDDPALERGLQWDMRNAMTVITAYAPKLAIERRERVLRAAAAAWEIVQGTTLPIQAIHGDITDDNVVGTRDALGRVMPHAVIDWGDLSTGWRVAEIAVTVSSLLHHVSALEALPAITAFDDLVHLSDDEVRALWPLVILRAAVIAVSGAHALSVEPENQYIADRAVHEWRIFETAVSVEMDVAEAAIEVALGRAPPVVPAPTHTLIPGLDAEAVRLDVASPHLHRGAFLQKDIEDRLAKDVTARGKTAVFAYGEHRLTRTITPGSDAPATAALFTQVRLAQDADLVAPFSGTVFGSTGLIMLYGDFGSIEICGAAPTSKERRDASAGDIIGRVPAETPVFIQWSLPGAQNAPLFTSAAALPAWKRLTADPAALLGIPPATWLPDPERERERRAKAVPGAAERYYETPPEMERGWREVLYDTTGRGYIDMVNNVAGIGHGHPAMADAVHAQLLTLNTNNRFLYASLAEYVERLGAMAPHPSLSAVLLVNSGSEAVDLALRLARSYTGRNDVVCLREAYHGWTYASDAVSTSDWDNPGAQATRPEWVHAADAVNTYRGKHRGADAGSAYAADVEAILSQLDGNGTPVGAFIAEPVFGNGGGVVYPSGYLTSVYDSVRRRGGLCIADEVQVGLGRLGHHTWGVNQQDAVPDIVCVAKALGNAYPLGCVYTTPEIAAAMEKDGMFFSSAGGATASAVAGLAVLDVMRDEDLQANAARVGDHLHTRLTALMDTFPIVGHVYGMGLYQGVELVRSRTTLEPAAEETAWICERLLDHGIIMQATSERRNVLKIKPPLTLTVAHADVFVDALAGVLRELERRGKLE